MLYAKSYLKCQYQCIIDLFGFLIVVNRIVLLYYPNNTWPLCLIVYQSVFFNSRFILGEQQQQYYLNLEDKTIKPFLNLIV